MKKIVICMGSSCYARGNKRNLTVMEDYIAKHGLSADIELSGSCCEKCCSEGPNIRIDGKLYKAVDPGSLLNILDETLKN